MDLAALGFQLLALGDVADGGQHGVFASKRHPRKQHLHVESGPVAGAPGLPFEVRGLAGQDLVPKSGQFPHGGARRRKLCRDGQTQGFLALESKETKHVLVHIQ